MTLELLASDIVDRIHAAPQEGKLNLTLLVRDLMRDNLPAVTRRSVNAVDVKPSGRWIKSNRIKPARIVVGSAEELESLYEMQMPQ